MTLFRPALLGLLVLIGACASPAIREPTKARSLPLILVSIDGFRSDYLERGNTPTLNALAAGGVRAEFMRPSFPTLTFPNHYTLVTGLRPDRHGVVANTMRDERISGERFSLSNRVAVANADWWSEAVPIWTTVQRGGRRAATMFWPGSEAPVHGAHPDYWAPFDNAVSDATRVNTVLGWLDLPVPQRPAFLTLYLNRIDTAGHTFGPDSDGLHAELRIVDDALALLLSGLARRGLRDQVNIVVVSDHGMTSTSPDRVIDFDEIVRADQADIVMTGVLTGIAPTIEHREAVERALLASPHEHMRCMRKSDVPARLHYGTHRRIPPILCIAEHGWVIVDRKTLARKKHRSLGEHGYDIDHPDMRSLFVANGPAFRRGVVVPAFDNVDVYPLLAHLLGERAEPNDGSLASARDMLRVPAR